MKVIEGMKELKLIEKKIADNATLIREYCGRLSNEMPRLGSDEEQKKKVAELIQSSEDLIQRYLKIKRDIEYTNIMTSVEHNGKKITISDLLVMKRKLIAISELTYRALDLTKVEDMVRKANSTRANDITVVKFFDENRKNEELSRLMDMKYNLDSRLEVVNAQTELMEAPVE